MTQKPKLTMKTKVRPKAKGPSYQEQQQTRQDKRLFNELHKLNKVWKKRLREIVNKDANVSYNRATKQVSYVLPQPLVKMAWRANLQSLVSRLVEEEGAGNSANIKARAMGKLREDLDTVLKEFGLVEIEVVGVPEIASALPASEEDQPAADLPPEAEVEP